MQSKSYRMSHQTCIPNDFLRYFWATLIRRRKLIVGNRQ